MSDSARHMLRDVLYDVAEGVRETYALRDDPLERGRWMAYSSMYSMLRAQLEAFDIDPEMLGLEREIFRDLPTFP